MEHGVISTKQNLPIKLPIMPLEGNPLFPGMITQMIITKKPIINLIEKAELNDGFLGLVMLKDPQHEDPINFKNLYKVGTVAKIHKKAKLPDSDQISIFLALLERFTIVDEIKFTHPLLARVEYHSIPPSRMDGKKDPELVALTRSLVTETKNIIANNPVFSDEIRLNMVNIDHPGQIADFITSILNIPREEQQEILETFSLHDRIVKVLAILSKEKKVLDLQQKVQSQINESVDKHKREHFLREMLKEIKRELGEPTDGKSVDSKNFREQLESLELDEDSKLQLEKDIKKFEVLDSHSPEYNVLSTYLEKVMSLPWENPPKKVVTLKKSKKLLDDQHYGMEKVKERIIEHLAVHQLEGSQSKSIVCLVGPPGVGKTSIARSIAEAMGRKLYHFSVGGMRDEAEIKGHRRTYIGAMPGKIIQGLLNVREKDPVFVIDEIDKLNYGSHGDPASALLEVLDPVQNTHFKDLYIDIPFDLSKVFFITTANTLHTIPKPLQDRMEVIQLSGYIDEEKIAIAKKYIIPKSLHTHGLSKNSVVFSKKALAYIAEHYARESGMRIFEQSINKIVRKLATKFVSETQNMEHSNTSGKKGKKNTNTSFWPVKIEDGSLEDYLGNATFRESIHTRVRIPGTAVGLAWTSAGGEVLIIEAQAVKADPRLIITGKLGEVMKESAQIAYTVSKQLIEKVSTHHTSLDHNFFKAHEIHLHVPEGATPKDGPSAGITMTIALLSLATNTSVSPNFAMTGEISLTNLVLPIGGLREKIVAARRNKIKNLIIPQANLVDLNDIPEYIKRNLKINTVSHFDEVFELLLPKYSMQKTLSATANK